MNARIIVVDEKEMFCEGLCRMLAQIPWVASVRHFSEVEEGIREIKETGCNIFIFNPFQSGRMRYDGIGQIRQKAPGIRIILLSDWEDGNTVLEAAKYPINGYFSKNMSFDKFETYLYDVMMGEYRLSDSLGSHLFACLVEQNESTLTGREYEIFRLLQEGRSNKEIAAALGISVNTARNHVASVMRKTGITSRYGFLNFEEGAGSAKRP